MLAVAGGKGGCGKTTTALGLARALASRGYDPLVVDGDCDMPDIHHYTGVGRAGGVDALADGQPVSEVTVRSSAFPGVSFVTGGRRKRLRTALSRLHSRDGPVLVDCPAGISADTVVPLRCADRTVVVSTDQPQCLEDTERTVAVADRVRGAVAGVILRKTAPSAHLEAQHRRSRPDERRQGSRPDGRDRRFRGCPVLGEVPTVESPLDNHQVQSELHSVSRTMFRSTPREQCSNRDSIHVFQPSV